MADVELIENAKQVPRCFVTGEELVLPESRQKATLLGNPVMVGAKGKELLDEFTQTGKAEVLPDGPAREYLAQLMQLHNAQQLLEAMTWLSQFTGARVEFMGAHVYAAVFKNDGEEIGAAGEHVVEAIGKLSTRVAEVVAEEPPEGEAS